MNKRETVQALVDAIQKGDFEAANPMLADDFRFTGPTAESLNKEAWLGMSSRLRSAFPDLDYHFKVIGAQGDVVRITSQLSGTHTGSFDLTRMQMGVIPATGKAFTTTREKSKVTVKEEKIAAWVIESAQGAGVMEILTQLDAETSAA